MEVSTPRMAAFPALPRDLVTEIYVNGKWTDISGDRYSRDDVVITRGRPNEAGAVSPSSLSGTLRNRDDDYSPGNPTGANYGSFGLNTPIRHAVSLASDQFARQAAAGWGSATTGQAYTLTGAGGTVSASDFSVATTGLGTMTVPVASAHRSAYLAGMAHRDVDVAVDVTLSLTDVTGGALEPANLQLRGSGAGYYMARVVIATDESVSIAVMDSASSVLAGPVTVAGLVHGAGQALRVRFQAEGDTLRAKVWAPGGGEPYGWQVSAHDTRFPGAGWVGVRSGVAAANSNTKPIAFRYSNLAVRSPRFAGEIAEIPENWDLSGNDAWVPIGAAGPLRRLGQGSSPLRSAMHRALSGEGLAVAYWPLEDSAGSRWFASGLVGGQPMRITPNPAGAFASFGAESGFASSESLPTPNGTVWTGPIPPYPPSTILQVMFLVSFPAGGAEELDELSLLTLTTMGTAPTWRLKYNNSFGTQYGELRVQAPLSSTGSVLFDGNGFGDVHGRKRLMLLRLEQIGGDIKVTTGMKTQDDDPAVPWVEISSTVTGRTFVRGVSVTVNPDRVITSAVAVGHVAVHATAVTLGARHQVLNAHWGEPGGRRLERLCAEETIPFSYRGDLDATEPMGYQRPGKLLDLLAACATTDMGTLHETRGTAGLAYRTRGSLYNQAPAVTLDYANGEVADPFKPVRDDQAIRNDVTVERAGGSSYRLIQTTGPLRVADPQDGGVGRYDTSVIANAATDEQLPDITGWLRWLGTINETRYRIIRIDLANLRVSANAALAAACLDADIDDVLLITNPRRQHTPDPIKQLTRGFTETLNDHVHIMSANCAPASPYDVAVLDAAGHKIDSSSSTLSGGPYSPTAPSLSVASVDPERWTTDPAHFPIEVGIAGERVTVTTITGTGSPQTFTVTRSVNGVVKQLPDGAPVTLWRRATLAP